MGWQITDPKQARNSPKTGRNAFTKQDIVFPSERFYPREAHSEEGRFLTLK